MESLYKEEDKSPILSETFSKLLDESGEEEEQSMTKCLSVEVQLEANSTQPVTEHATETTDNCRTPTAKEHRIPEMLTCPPAPKKQRKVMPTPVHLQFFCPMELDAVFKIGVPFQSKVVMSTLNISTFKL